MSSKTSIEAGRAHVQLGIKDDISAGLRAISSKIKSFGANTIAMGAGIFGAGAGIEAALGPSVAAFASYEQALANLRAAANPTAAEFEKLKAKIEEVATATGTDLIATVAGFSELVKAGASVEEVVGGLGEALTKFSRVAEMDVGTAAVVLVDSLTQFRREGLTAVQAMNIMSSGADAVSINLRQMSDSFANVGSVASAANQSMRDTAVAIALLGAGGIKGSEAGTSLRIILTRLQTGTESAGEAMRVLGLQVRDAGGEMLPLPQILENIDRALAGRSRPERDTLLRDLAGAYGQTALNALLSAGATGWHRVGDSMSGALTVEQKFAIMTDTFAAAMKKLWVQIQMVAVEIGAALAPAMRTTMAIAMPILEWAGRFIRANQELIQMIDYVGIGLIALGVTLGVVGAAIYAASYLVSALGVVVIAQTALALLAKASWLAWSGVVALFNFNLAITNFLMGLSAGGAATWTFASLAAKAATWLFNAALTVMNVLLGGGVLIAAAATLGMIAITLGVLGAAGYAAYHAIRNVFEVLATIPTTSGPIAAITTLFGEWYGIVQEVLRLLKDDFPSAMRILQVGFMLAVSQIRDLWPPLWTFIKTGFNALWELAASTFELKFMQAIAHLQRKVQEMMVNILVGAAIVAAGPAGLLLDRETIAAPIRRALLGNGDDLAAADRETERAIRSSIALAERLLADAAAKFGVKDSMETMAVRGLLGAVRYEAFEEMWRRADTPDASEEMRRRLPRLPGGDGREEAALRGSISSGFSNQALLGSLGAGGSHVQQQLALTRSLVEETRSMHEDMTRWLREIERVAGARMS